ncbi:hypothetical protein GOP47_0018858 [Adiantum capillus-veneris]|uniref:Uncharacterized protein n=1 Tax=Adiantum capillus-veneris TaxID=13818 RepID=A0A9D4Z964_ADICA|nr:hypothetical protein GOP47_0018858 [Adiantum capillus-veneris]
MGERRAFDDNAIENGSSNYYNGELHRLSLLTNIQSEQIQRVQNVGFVWKLVVQYINENDIVVQYRGECGVLEPCSK